MPLMFEHILVLGEICLAYFFVELLNQLKQNIDANVYHSSHNLLMLVYLCDSCGGGGKNYWGSDILHSCIIHSVTLFIQQRDK